MIKGIKIRKLDMFKDERGLLLKVIKQEYVGDDKFGEIYLTAVNPGEVRGNHYHQETIEWFCVIKGEGNLILEKEGDRMEIKMDEANPISVEVPPYVSHAIKNIGTSTMYLLAYANKGYNPARPDTFPADIKFS